MAEVFNIIDKLLVNNDINLVKKIMSYNTAKCLHCKQNKYDSITEATCDGCGEDIDYCPECYDNIPKCNGCDELYCTTCYNDLDGGLFTCEAENCECHIFGKEGNTFCCTCLDSNDMKYCHGCGHYINCKHISIIHIHDNPGETCQICEDCWRQNISFAP